MQPQRPNLETSASQQAILALQELNMYLNQYDPLHLIIIGCAIMAITLILLPRLGYSIASVAFLIVASDTISHYYKDVVHVPLESQTPYLVFLGLFACVELYCLLKVFKWL
jgi:hypothetical protein